MVARRGNCIKVLSLQTSLHTLGLAMSPRRIALFVATGLPVAVCHTRSALSLFVHARLATPLFKTGLVLVTCYDSVETGQYAVYVLNLCGERRAAVIVPVQRRLESISSLYANAC